MENKNMTEQESLRVITDMINRARKENIGRFNFLTVYGVLAFVMSLVAKFVEPGPWMWAWMAVPVVSLAVPFVLYRMWTWRGMFFSRILRNGFLLFAFMGLVAAYYSLKGNMNLTIVMSGCACLRHAVAVRPAALFRSARYRRLGHRHHRECRFRRQAFLLRHRTAQFALLHIFLYVLCARGLVYRPRA